MRRLFLMSVLCVCVFSFMACQPRDPEPSVGGIDFQVSVAFGSIVIQIEDIEDHEGTPLDFETFYALLDKETSGLRFFASDNQVDPIFLSFQSLEDDPLIVFDTIAGILTLTGDIELHTGVYAGDQAMGDFEVFKHDRASIRATALDGSFDERKSVAIPYLTLDVNTQAETLVFSISGNDAYGDDALSFLPAFTFQALTNIPLHTTRDANYVAAQEKAANIATGQQGNLRSWLVNVPDFTMGETHIQELILTQEEDLTFRLEGTRQNNQRVDVAYTLYVQDTTIGTIQYLIFRVMGEGPGTDLTIMALEGMADVSTITSNHLNVSSHATLLDHTQNRVASNAFKLTTDTMVGQLLEQLEKGHPFQSWKVVSLEHVPLSAQTFGPAPYRDFETDTLEVGDVLIVLSSNWESIRVYDLVVIDVEPMKQAINQATDEASLMSALLSAEAVLDDLDDAYSRAYFEAYQAAGYLSQTFENIYEIIGFIEGVHARLDAEREALRAVNEATDATSLYQALTTMTPALSGVDANAKEAYFKAYEALHYHTTNTFIAIDEVQAFVDEVNAEVAIIIALLAPTNEATNATTLLNALKDLDAITGVDERFIEAYYQAYTHAGYHQESTFKAIEAVQAFVDDVNSVMESNLALLQAINQATDAASLWTALNASALALENLDEANQTAYYEAYLEEGYDTKLWLYPDALQPFIDGVNARMADEASVLEPINNASDAASLYAALSGLDPVLDGLISANQDAYWHAYQEEGYDTTKTFINRAEVEAFITGVNEHVDSGPPPSADLSDLNAAANADTFFDALKALADAGYIENLIEANKTIYWQASAQITSFDSIQQVQGFINGVNDH